MLIGVHLLYCSVYSHNRSCQQLFHIFSPSKLFIRLKMSKWELDEEIKIFREYLRIPSVHPNIDYSKNFESNVSNKYLEQLNLPQLHALTFSKDRRII